MMVQITNSCSGYAHHWATKYPGFLGHIYSPGGACGPFPWLPYVLDNGAYGAFLKGHPFDVDSYRRLLRWAKEARSGFPSTPQRPLWALVPDSVGEKTASLELWSRFSGEVSSYGFPLAFAAQDGMTPSDVPSAADVVFIGGTTEWKWSGVIEDFCEAHPRVHVGRVNTYRRLRQAQDAGAESCDGTGWFRAANVASNRQLSGLRQWLREEAGEREREIQQEIHTLAPESDGSF